MRGAMASKSEYLIVDTSAFIKCAPLQEIGENVITIPEVIQEVTSKRQIKRLVVLPYDLQVKEADPDSVKFVTEFSKKTGDYPSLSSTDIKVMALTYELHKQHVGVDSINTEPIKREISYINHTVLSDKDSLAGFYIPSKKSQNKNNDESNSSIEENICENDQSEDFHHALDLVEREGESDEYYSADDKDQTEDGQDVDDGQDIDNRADCKEELEDHTDEVLNRIEYSDSGHDDNEEEEEEEEEEDNDDDEGWITPSNLKKAQQKINSKLYDDKPLVVSCITTDFAMQNVLKQMGLNVVALDGRMIRELRTFILRCYACFKTTSIMTKTFCPKCGYKTLKKVAVSVDDEGKQKIHINLKKPLTARGKKYSLPTFKGGKHANNPILCEDQPLPDQRPTRMARMKTNALEPDYIAGNSPFAVHDINSKSAMLGIRTNRQNDKQYWMYRNPNVVRRKPTK